MGILWLPVNSRPMADTLFQQTRDLAIKQILFLRKYKNELKQHNSNAKPNKKEKK